MFRPRLPLSWLSLSLASTLGLGLAGCKGDLCADEPPGFQLDLSAAADESRNAASLLVSVVGGGLSVRRSYDLGGMLADGATSLAVVLEPPPTESIELELTVSAHAAAGGAGEVLGQASGRFTATPNACNQFSLALGGPEPIDGGFPDGDVDLGVADGGDTGPPDGGPPDGDVPDGNIPDGDIPDGDIPDGDIPDVVDVDLGMPDSGLEPIVYPYAPSNFDPSALPAPVSALLGCGLTIFDTTSLAFTNWCGVTEPTPLILPPSGGPEVVLLALDQLLLGGGSTFRVVGNRALILAVDGAAIIDGTVDAGGDATTPGPAGSTSACPQGLGGTGGFTGGGGGAGGGGGFGDLGGQGGENANGAAGGQSGQTEGDATLVPLRGGCGGGPGAGTGRGLGGGGGGAIQISSTDGLTISGLVTAGGGGGGGAGTRSGGGGGGSGGAVLLEASMVTITGIVTALGGGGGGGGADGAAVGEAGGNGREQAGAGGNASFGAGPGGAGSSGVNQGDQGANGDSGRDGGGGGGGGPGRARINTTGTCIVTGTVAPAALGCN